MHTYVYIYTWKNIHITDLLYLQHIVRSNKNLSFYMHTYVYELNEI